MEAEGKYEYDGIGKNESKNLVKKTKEQKNI